MRNNEVYLVQLLGSGYNRRDTIAVGHILALHIYTPLGLRKL